jgi:uncharacterized membrane protein YbhN (UPF0104 family)
VDRGRRRWLRTLARFAVSGALLALVARFVDVGDVLARLGELRPGWVALGLALSVLQVLLLGWRWAYTAGRLDIDLPLRTAVAEYYLAVLVNQLLPGGITGDVSRAWRHARSGEQARPFVTAVVLERGSGQLMMTTVAVFSALALPWGPWWVRLPVGVVFAVWLALVLWAATRRAPADLAAQGLRADGRRALLGEALPLQLVSAALVVGSYIAVFVVAARAVGVDTPAGDLLPLVAPVLMTMLIPVTVAGWGIREGSAAALWGLVGLSPADGAAISVAYGLLVLASSLPGVLALIPRASGGPDRRGRPPPA